MKAIVEGDAVARWVSDQIGKPISPPLMAIGVAVSGVIIGGVVFSAYSGEDVEVTVAGTPRAWTPAFMRRLAKYVWDELECLRISITTQSLHVEDLALRMGAQHEGLKRDYFGPGRPAMLLGILRDEWKLTR